MKVLHLIPYMHPSAGGPPVVVDRWCVELHRLGIDAQVLTTDAYSGSDPSDDWIQNYRASYPIDVMKKTGPNGFGFSSGMKQALAAKLQSVDLVHVHNLWGYTNFIAARLCPAANVPFVVSTHGMLDPNSVTRKKLKKAIYGNIIEWPAIRKAKAIFVTHEEEARLAAQTCSGLPQSIVVPLGTEDPPAADAAELEEEFLEQFPECRNRQRVTFLGRLHSKKGLDLLIPAIARVREEAPDAMLVLAGPAEPSYEAELRQQCDRHGLHGHVVFAGMLTGQSKWAALAAADVFALPSYQENFAIALVEALRMGVPAVISDRINIWSDLIQAEAAIRCDLSSESISREILRLLCDPDLATQIGKNAAETAKTDYTWQKSGQTLEKTYEKVLSKQPRRL